MLGMPFVRQFKAQTAATEEMGSSAKIRTAEMRVRECMLLYVAILDANACSCDVQILVRASTLMRS
jgi:hypothetical protein